MNFQQTTVTTARERLSESRGAMSGQSLYGQLVGRDCWLSIAPTITATEGHSFLAIWTLAGQLAVSGLGEPQINQYGPNVKPITLGYFRKNRGRYRLSIA